MDLGISGKVAVVAASSKGLGRASAHALAAEGCKVVLCARNGGDLEATVDAITAAGGTASAMLLDITQPDAPAQLVQHALAQYGRLDIVVPNAGIASVPALVESLLADPGRLTAMRAAMLGMARVDAADRIAEGVIALARS